MKMLLNRMNHMTQFVCVWDFVRGAVGYCSCTSNGGYRKLQQRVTFITDYSLQFTNQALKCVHSVHSTL